MAVFKSPELLVKLELMSGRIFWNQPIESDFGYIFKSRYCSKVKHGSIMASLRAVIHQYNIVKYVHQFNDESKDTFCFMSDSFCG
jgi:hypothetical protein